MNLPRINSHNSWSQLEEVWLGDVYPVEWYEHLEPQVRDVFQKITEITKEDLTHIQHKLQSLGVQVQRPVYNNIDDFVDADNGNLRKPSICPRDNFVVLDNRIFVPDVSLEWNHILDCYKQAHNCAVVPNFSSNNQFNGANVVRTGRDILIDLWDVLYYGSWSYTDQLPEYRVRQVNNGGHMDGCFAILRPGLILANNYFSDYDLHYPGWEVIKLHSPTYCENIKKRSGPKRNGKFYDTTVGTNRAFNQHVTKFALDWVGHYTETYFELNCLMVNESTVIMLGENNALFRDLEQRGITVHSVPFRTRTFWDGGMHCLTVDIRRQSAMTDYFPDRDSKPLI